MLTARTIHKGIRSRAFSRELRNRATIRVPLFDPADIDNKILYWPLDFNALDYSGTDLDRSDTDTRANGSYSTVEPENVEQLGRLGGCMKFTAAKSTYIYQDTVQPYADNTTFSVSFWISGDQLETGPVYAEYSTADSDPLFLVSASLNSGADGTRGIVIRLVDDDGNVLLSDVRSTRQLDNRDNHVCVVCNTSTGALSLYINGSLDATDFSFATPATLTTTRMAIAFDGTSAYYDGWIDELLITSDALTEAEVIDLAHGPATRRGSNMPTSTRTFEYTDVKCFLSHPLVGGLQSGVVEHDIPAQLNRHDRPFFVNHSQDINERCTVLVDGHEYHVRQMEGAGDQDHHRRVFLRRVTAS